MRRVKVIGAGKFVAVERAITEPLKQSEKTQKDHSCAWQVTFIATFYFLLFLRSDAVAFVFLHHLS